MSSPGNLSAFWGADSPAIDEQLQITVSIMLTTTSFVDLRDEHFLSFILLTIASQENRPYYGQMSCEQPWINADLNPTANGQNHQWPSQILYPSSRFSNNSDYASDSGRSFGLSSNGWMNDMTPDDNSLISEPSTNAKDWHELHLETTRGLSDETLRFHSVRPIKSDETCVIIDIKGTKPSHMHENIRHDEPAMHSFTFGRGFNDHPNTSTAKYQAQALIGPAASTSNIETGSQPVNPSALVSNAQSSSPGQNEQLDVVNTASSRNDHENTTTKRARIRSTTRAGVPRWTALDLRRAQEMRRQGNTMAEIATALNRTENSVTGKLWRARGNDPHKSDKRHQDGESANETLKRRLIDDTGASMSK